MLPLHAVDRIALAAMTSVALLAAVAAGVACAAPSEPVARNAFAYGD